MDSRFDFLAPLFWTDLMESDDMTKEAFAKMLNGREYGGEISDAQRAIQYADAATKLRGHTTALNSARN